MILVISRNHILTEQVEKQLYLEINNNDANLHFLHWKCTRAARNSKLHVEKKIEKKTKPKHTLLADILICFIYCFLTEDV